MDKEKVIWGAIAAFLVVCSGYLVFGKIRPDDQLGFNNLQVSGAVSGSGTANQVAYFDGTNSIAGDTAFTVNAGTDTMTVTNLTVSGTCTGCGGAGGTGLQMVNSMTTGQIVFAMNTSSGATLAGFTLVTSTSALYLPANYTMFSTNTSMSMGTSTGWFSMQNATATLANVFNLNVSGTLDTKAGVVTCAGTSCLKTVTLSAAGCNIPATAGAGTSTLDYFGNNVERVVYFQPLAYSRCQVDWIPPDSWDGGTIAVKFIYGATTTDNNGDTWGIQGQGMGTGAAFTTAFSGATATVTLIATTTNAFTVSTATTLTVGGLTVDPDVVKLQVTRSASPGVSTNTRSLVAVKLEYGVVGLTDGP